MESLDTFYGAQWCPAEPADPPCSGAAELGIVDYGHRATPDVFLNAALATNGVWNSSQYSVAGVRRRVQGVPGLASGSRPRRPPARRSRPSSTRTSRSVCRTSTTTCPATRTSSRACGSRPRADVPRAGVARSDRRRRSVARCPAPRPAASTAKGAHGALRRPAGGAVDHHAVADLHDRVPDRQRAPRTTPVAASPGRSLRRRRSTASTSAWAPTTRCPTQYVRLLKNTVTFDFGDSFQFRAGRSPTCCVPRSAAPPSSSPWPVHDHPLRRSRRACSRPAARTRSPTGRVVTLGLASSSIPDFVSGVVLAYIFGVLRAGSRSGPWRPRAPARSPSCDYLFLPALALVDRVLRLHRPHDPGGHHQGPRRRLHPDGRDEGPAQPAGCSAGTCCATRCSRRCRWSASRSATCSAAWWRSS